jgi:hypothetical protein
MRCILTSNSLIRAKRSQCGGFNLTEAAIVLGVFGVILASLWGIVDHVREGARQDETVSQLKQVVQNIRDFYKAKARTGTVADEDITEGLIKKNAILSEMVRKNGGSFSAGLAWDGSELSVHTNGNGMTFFDLKINKVSRKTCAGLASKISGSDGPQGLVQSKINASAATADPIAPEAAAATCWNNNNNTLSFTYRLRQ